MRCESRVKEWWRGIGKMGLLAVTVLSSCMVPDEDAAVSPPPPTKLPPRLNIGIAYPGIAHERGRKEVEPALRELGALHIRIEDIWTQRQKVAGPFDWKPLEERLHFAAQLGLKVFLHVPARGPRWAVGQPRNDRAHVFTRMDAFGVYCDTLAKRFGERLHAVQFGNEWQVEYWYPGTPEQFLEAHNRFAQAFRTHSPGTRIVMGGFSIGVLRTLSALDGHDTPLYDKQGKPLSKTRRDRYLASDRVRAVEERIRIVMAGADYDVLDAHVYADAEYWHAYVSSLRNRFPGNPVVVSEFGGPDLRYEPADSAYAAMRMAVYLETLNAMEVEEAYFFRMHPTPTMSSSHAMSWLIGPEGRQPSFNVIRDWNRSVSVGP